MRRLLIAAAVVFLVGCGKDSPTEPPPTGTVRFTLDAQSCSNTSWNVQFFVDGADFGTFATPPGASHDFSVAPGVRRLSARAMPANLDWPTTLKSVVANATTVHILTCVSA